MLEEDMTTSNSREIKFWTAVPLQMATLYKYHENFKKQSKGKKVFEILKALMRVKHT